MTSSQLKTQQESILHFWNVEIRSAKDIHKATQIQIPMRTIYNNLKKLTLNTPVALPKRFLEKMFQILWTGQQIVLI